MTKNKIEKLLLALHGSIASKPFGSDALVFKVKHKMFALVSQNIQNTRNHATPVVTLKCEPADCIVLTSEFESVVPGYHMNKKHWITITLEGDVTDSMLSDLVKNSYNLVVSNLSKSDRHELDSESQ